MELKEAFDVLSLMLRVPAARMEGYYYEVDIPKPTVGENAVWSMADIDAKLVYACVRALRPKTVLELGTHLGYSALHIVAALDANNRGRLVTLDHTQHAGGVPRVQCRSHRLIPLTAEGVQFSRTLCFPVDMVLEDGSHFESDTHDFLSNCLPWLSTGALVMCHDVCHPEVGTAVTSGMRRALGEGVETVLVPPDVCGFGVWRKP